MRSAPPYPPRQKGQTTTLGTTCPTQCVGYLTYHRVIRNKDCETGPTVYRSYPRRLESLIICRWRYKGSTFYLVILRPWVLVRPRFEPASSRTAVGCSTNWANRSAVLSFSFWPENCCHCAFLNSFQFELAKGFKKVPYSVTVRQTR